MKHFGTILMLSAIFWARPPVYAQPYTWKSVVIGGGGFVDGIVFHPAVKGIRYCRTDMGGAYRWNDQAKKWEPMLDWVGYDDANLMGVESIALDANDSNAVYLACGTYTNAKPNAILRSEDKGRTFARTDVPFRMGGNENGRGNGERMAVDPLNGRIIYMGTRLDGLWKSMDKGITWNRVSRFPDITETPPAGLDARERMRWHWQQQGSGILFVLFDPHPQTGDPHAKTGDPHPKTGDPHARTGSGSTALIYAGVSLMGRDNLFCSRDGGRTWKAVEGGPTRYRPTHGVLSSDGFLYVTYGDNAGPGPMYDGAVWKLNTHTGVWENITPDAPDKPDAADKPDAPDAAATPDAGKARKFGYAAVSVDAQHPSSLIVSSYNRYHVGGEDIFRSTDAGKTWKTVFSGAVKGIFDYSLAPYTRRTGIHWLFDIEIDPFDSGHALFTTGYGGHETFDLTALDEDRPSHWRLMNAGIEETVGLALLSPAEGVPLLTAIGDYGGFVHRDLDSPVPEGNYTHPAFGNTNDMSGGGQAPLVIVRVGTSTRKDTGTIGYSIDGGTNWSLPASMPEGDSKNGSVAVSADGLSWIWSPEKSNAYVTHDRGRSWISVEGCPDQARIIADPVNPDLFYALSLFEGKLLISTDKGETFTSQDLVLPDGLPAPGPRGDRRGGQDRLYASPGKEGDLWIAAYNGLYHLHHTRTAGATATSAGSTFTSAGSTFTSAVSTFRTAGSAFTRLGHIQRIHAFGFGKAAPGSSFPALYLSGIADGVSGIFRSDDTGNSWIHINDDEHQWGLVLQITGDPKKYGRVYIGTHGRGILYGDINEAAAPAPPSAPGSITSFDQNWKFHLGEVTATDASATDASATDVPAATDASFDDKDWRDLNLPHDWSIEGKFDKDNPAGTGGGALPGGVGWYRKTFTVAPSLKNGNVFIDFDGVYRKSEVWINGHSLGIRPNGYISFRYDLTPYLKYGEKNTIAVRVDNAQQPNSRWYSGSGIYRNVWLVTTGKVFVDHWGTYITTPAVNAVSATVAIALKITNTAAQDNEVMLKTTIYDASGAPVGSSSTRMNIMAAAKGEDRQIIHIPSPHLWSVKDPYLYRATTQVISSGRTTDEYTTTMGIRSFVFDTDRGFLLNGSPVKINGVCDHHDLGCLGTAINRRALERQLEILQAMGCNAIRTSHNPPAPELLDLCDKMGFIVMDEAFDMWAKEKTKYDYHLDWDKWHKQDLEDQVLRDRNHPCVFIWSIGNEIPEQWNKDSSADRIALELRNIVRSLDTTRPITSAMNNHNPHTDGILRSGALDLVGYNYDQNDFPGFPQRFPGKKFIATETVSALETRGHYDMPSDSIRRWPAQWDKVLEHGNADHTCSAYDNVSAPWGSTHEETWKKIKKYDFLSGQFIWTGFDYIGEPTPYPWPARSSYFGIIDLAGFPKDVYYMYQSEWTDKPVLHLFPHWNWKKGDTVDVWAYYSQADEVELFLNGKSLGVKRKEGDELHVMWRVVFEPGALRAVSRKKDVVILTTEVKTAARPARIVLSADRNTIGADGNDLSFITARIVDMAGIPVPDAANLIRFAAAGQGAVIATDNGSETSPESFKLTQHQAFNGLCLAVVRSNGKPGAITITATAEGLTPASITLTADNDAPAK